MSALLFGTAAAWSATIVVDQTGAGDATTIEGGLQLIGEGDTLYIKAGDYYEGRLVVGYNNVSVVGDGPDVTRMVYDAAFGDDGSALGLEREFASVAGIAFEGWDTGIYSGYHNEVAVVENCRFINNYYGIYTASAPALTVTSSHFIGTYDLDTEFN